MRVVTCFDHSLFIFNDSKSSRFDALTLPYSYHKEHKLFFVIHFIIFSYLYKSLTISFQDTKYFQTYAKSPNAIMLQGLLFVSFVQSNNRIKYQNWLLELIIFHIISHGKLVNCVYLLFQIFFVTTFFSGSLCSPIAIEGSKGLEGLVYTSNLGK